MVRKVKSRKGIGVDALVSRIKFQRFSYLSGKGCCRVGVGVGEVGREGVGFRGLGFSSRKPRPEFYL